MNAQLNKLIHFLKKIDLKSLLFGILTIAVFAIVNHYFLQDVEVKSKYTEYIVKKGNISESIKSSGKAELVDEQKLRFNLTGKVNSVFFSDGEVVKKDQIIAELNKSELESDIKQAEINLQNSQISLTNLLEGNTSAEIMRAQNTVNDAKLKIDIAKNNLLISKNDYQLTIQNLDNDLDLAKKDVVEKEKSYELAKTNLKNANLYKEGDDIEAKVNYDSAFQGVTSEVRSILIEMEDAMIKMDSILGITEERLYQNNSYEKYLGAKDSPKTSALYVEIKQLYNTYDALDQHYKSLDSQSSNQREELIELLNSTVQFLDDAVIAFDNYFTILDYTVPSEYFTQSEIDSAKSSSISYVKSAKSQLESARNSRANLISLESLETTYLRNEEGLNQKELSLNAEGINLDKAKNTLNTLQYSIEAKKEAARLNLLSAENDLNNLKNTLLVQEEDLRDILDGSDRNDIAKARNEVTLKELALSRVKNDNSKYEIIAPFDGIIRQIDYKIGDNILSDDDKFVYIENPNLLSISILLDQIDIVKVQQGQSATVVFDSLPGKSFEGEINEINQTPEDNSGVISYAVSINLNRGEEKIFSGMTAEVEVIINEANDITLVPNRLIQSQGKRNMVLLKSKTGEASMTAIETGETDGKNTEIKSGLNEGDILLEETLSLSSGSPSSAPTGANPFGGRPSGAGGGGGFNSGAGAALRNIR